VRQIFLSLILLFCASCRSSLPISSFYGDHLSVKQVTELSSDEGGTLLEGVSKDKLNALKNYWVAQKKSYCGVCSVVIVSNTLGDKKRLDQVNFFTRDVNKIIRAEQVTRMGLTLSEMSATCQLLNPSLKVEAFHSHTTGLDQLKRQLRLNNKNKQSQIIVNFSRKSLAGTGMGHGHFSIVAAYNVEKRQVLILEVNGDKESFWVSDKALFNAMLAIDPVSRIPRGWARISK